MQWRTPRSESNGSGDQRPENRGYADNGIAGFKSGCPVHEKALSVDLDPVREINHCIG